MEKDILIDGYNVIKNNLMFQSLVSQNFANARDLLIRQLKNRYRHTTDRVIVVFDGNGEREQVSHDDHIRIIFSRQSETADSVIARLAAEARVAGREIEMYSDDQEVRSSVKEQGGGVCTTGQLSRRLNAAPRDAEYLSRHRQAMRRMYGIDPLYKGDDEPDSPHSPGKKKKKKSSRRSR